MPRLFLSAIADWRHFPKFLLFPSIGAVVVDCGGAVWLRWLFGRIGFRWYRSPKRSSAPPVRPTQVAPSFVYDAPNSPDLVANPGATIRIIGPRIFAPESR